jgi:glutathione S-transferase
VAWQRDDAVDPRKFAHGKLPVLRANGRVIHDSDNIRLFLEEIGADFWGDTSARDKAMGRALIRMAEDHLYFHVVNDRWMNEDVWPHILRAYFMDIPKLIRGFVTGKIRNTVRQGLHSQGIGRMTEAECLVRLDQDLDAIRGLLTDNAFLMGAKPTLPDFSVASVLTNIAASPVPTPTSLRVKDDQVLMGYVDRMKEIYD